MRLAERPQPSRTSGQAGKLCGASQAIACRSAPSKAPSFSSATSASRQKPCASSMLWDGGSSVPDRAWQPVTCAEGRWPARPSHGQCRAVGRLPRRLRGSPECQSSSVPPVSKVSALTPDRLMGSGTAGCMIVLTSMTSYALAVPLNTCAQSTFTSGLLSALELNGRLAVVGFVSTTASLPVVAD